MASHSPNYKLVVLVNKGPTFGPQVTVFPSILTGKNISVCVYVCACVCMFFVSFVVTASCCFVM